MDLIERIQNEITTKGKIGFADGCNKITEAIGDLIETLQDSDFKSCLIHPPETNNLRQFVSITINSNGYVTFKLVGLGVDNSKEIEESIRLKDLPYKLKFKEYLMIIEILSILSDKNSTFELN